MHIRWTRPERELRPESSILTQRKSFFTGLSREARLRLEEIGRSRDPGKIRSFLVCCRVLPDSELERLLERGEVHARSRTRPFSYYRIIYRGDVQVRRVGLFRQWRYCVSPEHFVPDYDKVAAFYLILTNNPLYFHRKANALDLIL